MKFGFGRADITPLESVPLAGYGNDTSRYSEDADYRLYATCLAFADKTDAPVLVYSLDLCVPPYHRFRDWVMPRLAEAVGVDPDRILLACTHNHSSPSLDAEQEPAIIRYQPYLIEKLIAAAKQALSDLAETTLQVGSVQTIGLNHIRRYVLEDGTFAGDNYGHFQLSPIAGHESEPDRQLQLVKLRREGKQDVLLANFQMHPHRAGGSKKYLMSADIIGAFREEMEKDGCLFAYFTGGSGNVNGHSRIKEENLTADHQEHGKALSAYARQARFVPAAAGAVQYAARTVSLPVDHSKDHLVPICKEIQVLWAKNHAHTDYRPVSDAHGIRNIYHADAIIFKSEMEQTLDIPIWALTIGDVAFVAAPYEMFDTNGREIKEGSPFKMTFVLTCTNERYAYIPSALGFRNGGYSADLCRFAPGAGELLVDNYVNLLKELKR